MKDKEVYELKAQQIWLQFDFKEVLHLLNEYWIDYRAWERVKSETSLGSCDRALDVGCGVVSVLNVVRRDFPDMKLLGLDPLMHEYSTLCPMDSTIEWHTGYLENLDVDDGAFPVVFCSNAIDHVENLGHAMAELRRVVRSRGYLVLTVDVFAREIERNVGHPYTFTADSIRRVIEANGFRSKFSYLERRKLGMGPYARYRLREGQSRQAVMRRAWFRKVPKAWCKQILRRGSLGELIMVAQKN